MEDRRYLFFVSSTYEDLKEERNQVIQAIMDEGHFPMGMENFPASGKSPLKSIQEHFEGCDYFILIIGGRYGSINRDSKISYTEEEYNYAVEHGIPVLAFLHGNPESIPTEKTDRTAIARKKLKEFRERVENSGITIKEWLIPGDLKSLVKSSIHSETKSQERPGWIRANPNISIKKTITNLEVKKKKDSYVFKIDDLEFKMIHVERGEFTMGATQEQKKYALKNEKPDHLVCVEDNFWIGETTVTQELWVKIMGYNPSYFSKSHGHNDCPRCPVEQVTWNDCKDFIDKLNELFKEKFKGHMEFDFPTEAQWEFAARGGNKSKHYVFSGGNSPGEVAYFDHTSKGMTHPVPGLKANELGIYDMSGNVWEWCKDVYAEYSSKGREDNSNGKRVERGGCWHSERNCCRVTYREFGNMTHAGNSLGLRLALNKI